MNRTLHLLMWSACAVSLALLSGCNDDDDEDNPVTATPTLTGRAILPAATFADGPTSGTAIGAGPINGQTVPFVNQQPVQGFSAVLDNKNGTFLAMSDNGFGSFENSADYHLRVYTLRPDFKTKTRNTGGSIAVEGFFELHDPDRKIPFAITNHFSTRRILTGADFDIESFQRVQDGTFWFGDEFGPFLLHTDASGKVLEAPVPLPDFDNPGKALRSPQNPFNEEASAIRIMNAVRNHARSFGNQRVPVFSPYHVMLSDDNATGITNVEHYARDESPQPGLQKAASDIFDVSSIKQAGYPVVTWTVNDKPRMLDLMKLGVSGIISDRPDLLLEAVREYDANGDGTRGDYIGADGLIDSAKFDAQGHRGARNLRPENTLPAMEAALDALMTTLETDSGVTKDGVPVLDHDPYIEAAKCRRADGAPYTAANQVLIKNQTAAEIQSTFICDTLFRGDSQRNDRSLSPVASAYSAAKGLIDPYVMPTVPQLFEFVDAYVSYYQSGPGATHPDAVLRRQNAAKVRYNIETKINPRSDKDALGIVYQDRTLDVATMANALASVIQTHGLTQRADIQSFDFRTLLHVQEKYPAIRTVYLFGDFPIYPDPENTDDGTNMQDENGANTPWMAGLYWPYRATVLSNSFRVQRSGGFEGMALSSDGTTLLPLLEKPLVQGEAKTLLIHEFNLLNSSYTTGKRFKYPLNEKGVAIGDFILFDSQHGLVIERDDTQGDLNGYKTIQRITLGAAGAAVSKVERVNLLNVSDPDGLGVSAEGDVGVGGNRFAFPFVTIENVVVLGERSIGVINDNNYPFSIGRHVGSRQPDDNEFITIDLGQPLSQ